MTLSSRVLIQAGAAFLNIEADWEYEAAALHEVEPEYHHKYRIDYGKAGAVEVTEYNGKIKRITRLRSPFGRDPHSIPESRTYS